MSNNDDPTCFIAMPITTTPDQQQRYNNDSRHWLHVLDHLFAPAVEAAGFIARTPVSAGSDMIHARIIKQLTTSNLVLCDLSALNANVLFELGVRTSLNLPIALVAEEGTKLPFDTSGINTHFYDPSLLPWTLAHEIKRLEIHIQASASSCAGANPLWSQFGLEIKAQEPSSSGSTVEAKLDVAIQEVSQIRSEMTILMNASENDPSDYLRETGQTIARPLLRSLSNQKIHQVLVERVQLDCESLLDVDTRCVVQEMPDGVLVNVEHGTIPPETVRYWQRIATSVGLAVEVHQ